MQTRNDFLGQVDGPELFIGLVGAIGTNLPLVVEALSEELRELSYDPHEIHLSHLIRPIPEFKFLAGLDGGPQEIRIQKYMDAGDALRRNMGSGDGLALLSVMAIQDYRQEQIGKTDTTLRRKAYILNSFKHPDEVKTLRKIYGQAFCVISCTRHELNE